MWFSKKKCLYTWLNGLVANARAYIFYWTTTSGLIVILNHSTKSGTKFAAIASWCHLVAQQLTWHV